MILNSGEHAEGRAFFLVVSPFLSHFSSFLPGKKVFSG
jgi:hypothetical protein